MSHNAFIFIFIYTDIGNQSFKMPTSMALYRIYWGERRNPWLLFLTLGLIFLIKEIRKIATMIFRLSVEIIELPSIKENL